MCVVVIFFLSFNPLLTFFPYSWLALIFGFSYSNEVHNAKTTDNIIFFCVELNLASEPGRCSYWIHMSSPINILSLPVFTFFKIPSPKSKPPLPKSQVIDYKPQCVVNTLKSSVGTKTPESLTPQQDNGVKHRFW